jgi:hypothetical protein
VGQHCVLLKFFSAEIANKCITRNFRHFDSLAAAVINFQLQVRLIRLFMTTNLTSNVLQYLDRLVKLAWSSFSDQMDVWINELSLDRVQLLIVE